MQYIVVNIVQIFILQYLFDRYYELQINQFLVTAPLTCNGAFVRNLQYVNVIVVKLFTKISLLKLLPLLSIYTACTCTMKRFANASDKLYKFHLFFDVLFYIHSNDNTDQGSRERRILHPWTQENWSGC